jgi:hypothetical protein
MMNDQDHRALIASPPQFNISLSLRIMKIAIISARYLEQHAIEAFFGEIFGYGEARVSVSILATVTGINH